MTELTEIRKVEYAEADYDYYLAVNMGQNERLVFVVPENMQRIWHVSLLNEVFCQRLFTVVIRESTPKTDHQRSGNSVKDLFV